MERSIGIELRKLSNLSCRYFEQQTNKKEVDALTGTNGWIIGYIAGREAKGEAVYQRDLEAHFGITRSTAVPEDRRLRRLVLTDKAAQVTRLMEEDHQSFENTLRQGFTEAELQTLFALLDRLQGNLKKLDDKEAAL